MTGSDMTPTDELAAELVRLGRAVDVGPPPDDLAELVLRRIAVRAASGRDRRRRRFRRSTRRWVAVVVLLVLIALGLTPPVRAALRDWLDFGGVLIRTGPTPATTATPSVPPTPGSTEPSDAPPGPARVVTVAQARAAVAFDLALPPGLGRPDRVEVSADRRVVSMTWGRGASALRLDQFDGTVAWIFVKQIGAPVRFVDVDGRDAVWIAEPHPIAYVDRDGRERTESARLAGPSLLWERDAPRGTVTQRLEGPSLNRQRAVALAASLR